MRPTSFLLGVGTLLALLAPGPAAAQDGQTHRIYTAQEAFVLCPGQEAKIKVYTEVKRTIMGKEVWVAAGNVILNVHFIHSNPDGTYVTRGGGGNHTTHETSGGLTTTFKADPNSGHEVFCYFAWYLPGDPPVLIDFICVTVLTLNTSECERIRKEAEQGLHNPLGKLDDLLGTALPEAKSKEQVRKAADGAARELKGFKTGKRFTAGKLNAALKELEALKQGDPPVAIGQLEKVIDARRAKCHDLLELIGKLEGRLDPTKAWFADLKSLSVDQLAALLRQCEAANDAYLKEVLACVGNPPTFERRLLTYPVAIVKTGAGCEAVLLPRLAKGDKIERFVQYEPHARNSILDGPYKIHQEAQNRAAKAGDEATRKRLRELHTDAQKVHSRCQTGDSLVKYVGIFQEQKRAGNDKAAADTRLQHLVRFQKQLDMELKAKSERDAAKD